MKKILTSKEFAGQIGDANKKWIYLDDIRTPIDDKFIVVRNYDDFIKTVSQIGLDNITLVSLDHDLGNEDTGYDCAKWLVQQWMSGQPVVKVVTHSANPVGVRNITSYINNYLKFVGQPETCSAVNIRHT